MYRKPGSTMTAVEAVSAMYDGPIPDDVLVDARAEDARFAAENPGYRVPTNSRTEEAEVMVRYYAEKVKSLIAAKRACDARGIVNSAWSPLTVDMWFQQWRQERRRLAALLKVRTHGFPGHTEMLAEFAAGIAERKTRSAA